MDREASTRHHKKPEHKRLVSIFLQILFSLVILGCSIALATYYLKTSPKAKPRKRTPRPPLVKVSKVSIGSHIYTIESMGLIIGAEVLDLNPRVSGEIINTSKEFIPGGHFAEGAPLMEIDPTDYELSLLQLQSEFAKTQSDFDLEMGNQLIARKEFELLGQEVSKTEKKLMLRMPQLGIAKANLEAMKAKLQQAKLNLARTVITAPINSVILEKKVGTGSRVSPSTTLARLAGTDKFWIRLTVAVDQLEWLNIPTNSSQAGSAVRIYPQSKKGADMRRIGHLIRLGPGLEQDGRMAQLYAEVIDPLCLQRENEQLPKLLLDSFVRAEIEGREFTDTVVIARNHLRANDQVWLLNPENRLEKRDVDVIARTRDKIFIASGLTPNDRLIVSAISNPTEGTVLKVMPDRARKMKMKAQETDR